MHHAWSWTQIIPDMREAFVMTVDNVACAIWASKVGSAILLASERYYRLDYLELDAARRGDGATSVALFGLIAKRAMEHAASGIVLSTFDVPALIETYRKLGAVRSTPRGWNHPAGLVGLTFPAEAVLDLQELLDDFKEDSSPALP